METGDGVKEDKEIIRCKPSKREDVRIEKDRRGKQKKRAGGSEVGMEGGCGKEEGRRRGILGKAKRERLREWMRERMRGGSGWEMKWKGKEAGRRRGIMGKAKRGRLRGGSGWERKWKGKEEGEGEVKKGTLFANMCKACITQLLFFAFNP